jgi:hypothetical protein
MEADMSNAVEKSVASSTSEALLASCKQIFKAHGLVAGKTSSKYGDLYQFKTEAFGNDPVSRDAAKSISDEIEAEAKKICQGKLQITGISTKYGEGYSITIKADGIQLGRNGINLASKYAQDFRMTSWRYEMTEEHLGKEATINGKTLYLAGVEIKRNGNVRVVVQDADGQIYFFNNGNVMTFFEGKPAQTMMVGR